ncbi:hypothetical protein C8R44DRAFT_824578, partial [Mycena epipterygia]
MCAPMCTPMHAAPGRRFPPSPSKPCAHALPFLVPTLPHCAPHSTASYTPPCIPMQGPSAPRLHNTVAVLCRRQFSRPRYAADLLRTPRPTPPQS